MYTIEKYKKAFDEYFYPSLIAKKLGITRQAVYYRLSKSKELREYWNKLKDNKFQERLRKRQK